MMSYTNMYTYSAFDCGMHLINILQTTINISTNIEYI